MSLQFFYSLKFSTFVTQLQVFPVPRRTIDVLGEVCAACEMSLAEMYILGTRLAAVATPSSGLLEVGILKAPKVFAVLYFVMAHD